jgi:hypothetical protein
MWITKAWQPISPEVTAKEMDGSADGMLWNGSEENGNVRSECEEYEGNACEDGDSDTDW